MEKKIYTIENLDCANCAAKIEARFNALPQVQEASITFATRQLRLTAEDPDSLIPELTEIARSVEPEMLILPREHDGGHHDRGGCGYHHDHKHHDHCNHHGHGDGCGCGHHHNQGEQEGCCGHPHEQKKSAHEDHEHAKGDSGLKSILVGAALFAAGLLLGGLGFAIPSRVSFVAGYLAVGWEVIANAWKNLRRGHMLDENFLMSIASIGAFFIGEFAEAVGVMLFYRVGEYFEHKAVERSRSQIMEAVDLRPEVVNLADGRTVPAGEARVGDILLVRPGDRIPLDGVVLSGESRIDTAPITGEPVPVGVKPGSEVISGCVNTSGQLTIRVEKPLQESMVTRILNSVENAAASKPKIDRFITRFARIYTPVVVAVAALVAVAPSIITGHWDYWIYTALSFLVMSCPCALVLSVPLAFFSGIGAGSRKGILFKGGLSIEAMSGVKAVAMDKTGTLTKGEFKVQQVAGGLDVLRLCASCEQNSTHPIAVSITAAAKEQGIELFIPDSLEEISGRGIRALAEGKQILCGNALLMEENEVTGVEIPRTEGTLVLVAMDRRFVGYIVIADTVKAGAREAVARLKDRGIFTAMLTGDREESAVQIARQVGIHRVFAKLLPQEKLERLQTLRREKGAVMYVGDGINDAPVLAGADVGAAMGSGADAAIEAADVVFMTSDVMAIPQSLEIARRTKQAAWQNVVFALAVKFAVMLLGLFGFASMWMAVFADSGVAILCVLNAVRLLYRKE